MYSTNATSMTSSSKESGSNEDKIIRMPNLDFEPDPRGLGYVLFSCMEKHNNNVAQIDGITGEKDTYKSLLQRCTRTAIKMRSMGVTSEDIISICTFNHLNSCVPYLATIFLGAKINGLDPTISVQDTIHLLGQVTPRIIFVGPEAVGVIEAALAESSMDSVELVVLGSSSKYQSFDDFLSSSLDETDFKPYEAKSLREIALILFSSGTSGLAKGICIHHYGFLCQLQNMKNFGFCDNVVLMFASLYWISTSSYLCSAILGGTARMIIPQFNVDVIWSAIHKYRPTCIVGAPYHFMSLFRAKSVDVDGSSVRHITVGGSTVAENHVLAIQEMFPSCKIFNGYGQTEMATFITVFKPSHHKDCELMKTRITSTGTGIPGIWYKVVDLETDELLGPNHPGELRIKTELCFSGYYNMDSSQVFDEDGWYKTGDVAYYDEEKCFYVLDRVKEFLKFQQWHISPSLIENVLTAHPDISTALVIGMPHEIDENHLMALVVLKNKISRITPKEIEKYVEEQVDDRKRLRGGVKIVESIPVGNTGKFKRREIRDMVLRGEL